MIRIEEQPLSLKAVPDRFVVNCTEVQRTYLDLFKKGRNISETVASLLQDGRLVNFNSLYELVTKLYQENLIQNPIFKAFFKNLSDNEKPKTIEKGLLSNLFKKEKPDGYLLRHPFFRAQNPVVTSLFTQHAEVIEVKAGTVLCQTGHLERDLFFMIDGEAGIYRNTEGQGRRLIGFLGKDAVIGEVGFFMGELRTADVIATKHSKLVAIRYDENSFGRIINKEIAKNLQARFRVLHALAKSPFLKNIPEEAIHALIFAGRTRDLKEFDVICKEEDENGDRCYIVVNGSVVVSKGTKSINVLGPGEAFGEIALFFTQGKRTATVMAQRQTTVLEIVASDFYRLLAGNLLLACEFEKLALDRAKKSFPQAA